MVIVTDGGMIIPLILGFQAMLSPSDRPVQERLLQVGPGSPACTYLHMLDFLDIVVLGEEGGVW